MATDGYRVPAGEFKTRCLQLMDEVQANRTPIVITKRGKPIAKLVPYEASVDSLFGFLQGSVTVVGDLVEPTGEAWEADA